MRPYLAIIKDSFLEALASRTLWVMLILITVVLLGLAPLSYRFDVTTRFRRSDVVDPRTLAQRLTRSADSDAVDRIGSLIDDGDRKQLREIAARKQDGDERDFFTESDRVRDVLNGLLDEPDLYRAEDWRTVYLSNEARQLVDRPVEELEKNELQRRNRLLLEAAFGDQFRPRPRQSVVVTYFGADCSPELPIGKERFDRIVEQLVLAGIMGLLVGTVAVFAAILVTSNMIPEMFRTGSLHLLLSKPVSRSLVLLTKYLGGCAFILLLITYLLSGLWLIAGTRFGIWNQGMLWCIPLFVFLFAIYYAVSALAGVIWKNAVVSVVVTLVFWAVCFSVGTTKLAIEDAVFNKRRIIHVVTAGDTLLSVNDSGQVHRFNAPAREWEEVFQGSNPLEVVVHGPFYDRDAEVLVAAEGWRQEGPFRFPRRKKLAFGKRREGWRRELGPALPSGTFELLVEPGGSFLAVANSGLYRFRGNLEKPGAQGVELFGFQLPLGSRNPFENVGPEASRSLQDPAAAAIGPSGDVAVYSRGRILLVRPSSEGGRFELVAQRELTEDRDEAASLALGGERLLVAFADGRLLVLDPTAELATRFESTPERTSQPRFVEASPDGQHLAVVYQNGQCWIGDCEAEKFARAPVSGQGNISCAMFQDNAQLLVADRSTRVSHYDLASGELVERFTPRMTRFEMIFRYGIVPLYRVFPKPSELDNTVQYLLTGKETTDMAGLLGQEMQAAHVNLRPWAPVRSGLIFIGVVLLVACIYTERQDF